MFRREFVNKLSIHVAGAQALVWCGPPLLSSCQDKSREKATQNEGTEPISYLFPQLEVAPNDPLPEGKAIPFNWDHFTLSSERKAQLKFEELAEGNFQSVWLRITSATDIRPRCQIGVHLAGSGEKLAHFDMQYGYMCQLFEVEIPIGKLDKITAQGLELRMIEGSQDVWFFSKGNSLPAEASLLSPHLLLVKKETPQERWLENLLSYNSIQFFGWAEGVTLDGLYETKGLVGEARAKEWFENHLNSFFNENQQFVYTTIHNNIKQQQMDTVEGVLPFAVLAKYNPDHPTIDNIISFCQSKANKEGVIADGDPKKHFERHLSTEANYTISYPLAVIAQQKNRDDLYPLIVQTILGRKKWLTDETGIYQSGNENTHKKRLKNWGRGVAWYVLGLARTLEYLPDDLPEKEMLVEELTRTFRFIAPYQQSDGLFPVFLHEPETGTETSGSAGIAAALAVANKLGYTESNDMVVLEKVREGLRDNFTPDGFIKNVVQHNAGGRELQANGYRTISQYALGFYAIIENYMRKDNA